MGVLYTIGHSNHPAEHFLTLLDRHGIDFLADVRAVPYSRRFPQFRKQELDKILAERAIAYRWMGDSLGGLARRSDFETFEEIACSPGFQEGLDTLEALVCARTPVIMCAEREPMDCHRTILIGRHLRLRDLEIRHILADGTAEANSDFERRLVAATGAVPLLESGEDAVAAAYEARAAAITRR